MNQKYIYIIGAFVTGIVITLLLAPFLRTTEKELGEPVRENSTTHMTHNTSAIVPEEEKALYTSHIAGNETRYGGARISNTEITGNLSIHGGLTAYNLKAYAGTINGGATITNGLFQDMLTIHGGLTGRNITADALKIFGAATLHNTSITATLNVKGGMNAQTLRARAAQIHGGAVIMDGHFAEQLRATGVVTLIDSDTPEVILHAPKTGSWLHWIMGHSKEDTPTLTLEQSRVATINIITEKQSDVCVKIAQESTVGTIRFTGKPGIVIIDESSNVDSVINGTIQADTNK